MRVDHESRTPRNLDRFARRDPRSPSLYEREGHRRYLLYGSAFMAQASRSPQPSRQARRAKSMSGTFGKINSLAVGGRTPSPAFLERLARRAVLARLRMLRRGEIALIEGNDREVLGLRSPDCDFCATITIRDARFYSCLAFGGSIGAAEAYMQGFWTCDDLVTLFRIITR